MKEFLMNENGQGLVEYALILALVSVVCMIVLKALGVNVTAIFSGVAERLGNTKALEYTGKIIKIDTQADFSWSTCGDAEHGGAI